MGVHSSTTSTLEQKDEEFKSCWGAHCILRYTLCAGVHTVCWGTHCVLDSTLYAGIHTVCWVALCMMVCTLCAGVDIIRWSAHCLCAGVHHVVSLESKWDKSPENRF